jgi:hypothetical protein
LFLLLEVVVLEEHCFTMCSGDDGGKVNHPHRPPLLVVSLVVLIVVYVILPAAALGVNVEGN